MAAARLDVPPRKTFTRNFKSFILLLESAGWGWRRTGKVMKLLMGLTKNGQGAGLLLVGVAVLVNGCVAERDVYVQPQPAPMVVEPTPPPPEPVALPAAPPPEVVFAPAPVAPPAPITPLRSYDDLDQMLGPIALYPDPLLAEVLPAATVPEQIVLADRYVREGGDPNAVDLQPWDRSVKALARYPEVLSMMDNNLAWTTDVGLAFLNQPIDVMEAVQRLRQRAYALGNLQSGPQQVVYVQNRVIEIVPAAPQIIYVPVYAPDVVYVQRPPVQAQLFISFGVGRPLGAWLNHDCDWEQHRLLVWRSNDPRPADWWARRPEDRRREQPRNLTVWQPRQPTQVARGGDRGWGLSAVRTPAPPITPHPAPQPAPRPEPIHSGAHGNPVAPPPATVHPPRPISPPAKTLPERPTHSGANPPPSSRQPVPAPRDPNQPTQVRSGAHPVPVEPKPVLAQAPQPPKESTRPLPAPKPQPGRAPAPVKPQPVSGAVARPTGGAFTGIESTRQTQQFSQRGQQSRETIAKPAAPARPASAPARETRAPQPNKNSNGRTK